MAQWEQAAGASAHVFLPRLNPDALSSSASSSSSAAGGKTPFPATPVPSSASAANTSATPAAARKQLFQTPGKPADAESKHDGFSSSSSSSSSSEGELLERLRGELISARAQLHTAVLANETLTHQLAQAQASLHHLAALHVPGFHPSPPHGDGDDDGGEDADDRRALEGPAPHIAAQMVAGGLMQQDVDELKREQKQQPQKPTGECMNDSEFQFPQLLN